MRKTVAIIFACLLLLCGCATNNHQTDYSNDIAFDSGYEKGYEEGYSEGYNDALEKSIDNLDYSEELQDFQSAIADLMYDHDYDTVQTLLSYNRTGVETALNIEFGTHDIDVIIEYLEELSGKVIGNCEICGAVVYADEFAILPDGIECAHAECVSGNDSENSAKINKDK